MAYKKLTVDMLKRFWACNAAIIAFRTRFGESASIIEVIEWLKQHEQGPEWQAWILAVDLQLTKAFLEAGADINSYNGDALYWALGRSCPTIAEYLLQNGLTSSFDCNQLSDAVNKGYTRVVSLILDQNPKLPLSEVNRLYFISKNQKIRDALTIYMKNYKT